MEISPAQPFTLLAAMDPNWHLSLPIGAPLWTDYGLGTLTSARPDGFLCVALPFGAAFIRPSALATFPPGARVSTDFGRGCVRSVEARPGAGLVYQVALLDCNLANGGVATGALNARGVRPRAAAAGATFAECLEDADAERALGNAAYVAGAMPPAIDAYQRSLLRLQDGSRGCSGPAQREVLRDKFTTCLSNLAIALNREGTPASFERALRQATEVRAGGPS